MRNYGVITEEMCNAVSRLPKIPFTEMDIVLIRSNPSLSWFQKWKLVREIKKNMAMN
jgi:hypothetical protein